jgi:HK97 family phage prohead protease
MADQGNITTAAPGELNTAAVRYAMPDGSYPIRPANVHGREDLSAAIRAVGRGNADHDAIRRHIMARARALGLSSLIPENWAADGSERSEDMSDLERRLTPGADGKLELRDADGHQRIGGYAAVFNRSSRNLGGFTEVVDPVAFNQSRGDNWPGVMARYNHTQLIGTTAAGTLQLRTDQYGLLYEVEPPRSLGHVLELVQRGDVTKSSFAFRTISDDWQYEDGLPKRTLLGVHLVDVAPVDDPAYLDTSVGMRGMPATEGALRSLAERMSADLDEVRSLAAQNELRRFFVRTDKPGQPATPRKKTYGPAARMALLGRETDPWS